MEIFRAWAMPNKDTFSILPIKNFLDREIEGKIVVDPMCGNSRYAKDGLSNDLNPDSFNASSCMDALEWLKELPDNFADTVLFDPPYSLRQLKECYDGIGRAISERESRTYYSDLKDEIARIVKPKGCVISFGWNSIGMGSSRDFDKTLILMVCHGGHHNDTIIVKERKWGS